MADHYAEISALVDAGAKTAAIADRVQILKDDDIGGVFVPLVTDSNGSVKLASEIVNYVESRMERPMRRRQNLELVDLDSFIRYVNDFKTEDAVVFASKAKTTVVAVFDHHVAAARDMEVDDDGDDVMPSQATPGWCTDRVSYGCPLSRQWKTWTAKDGCVMRQEEFADFIEVNADDVVDSVGFPGSADLIELSRNLQIFVGGKFVKKLNPTTGESTFINETEHGAQSTKIPKAFKIGIPVFEGDQPYMLECRVRFEMKEGVPRFSFRVHNRDVVLDDAFTGVTQAIGQQTQLPVYSGNI